MLYISLPGAPSDVPDSVQGCHQLALSKATSADELDSLATSLAALADKVAAVIAGKHTDATQVQAAADLWPKAQVWVSTGVGSWGAWGGEDGKYEPGSNDDAAVADVVLGDGVEVIDAESIANSLIWECYKQHSWGEDKHRVEIDQLAGKFELLLESNAGLSHLQEEWFEAVSLGREAADLCATLKQKLSQREPDAEIDAWVKQVSANKADRVANSIRIELKKSRDYRKKQAKKQRLKKADYKPSMPELELGKSGHPNAIANLKPSSKWTLLVDETGTVFHEGADELLDKDNQLGKVIGLLVPDNAKLSELPRKFHAVDKTTAHVEQVLSDLMRQPVGILGFTSKDPATGRFSWFQKIEQLVQWVLYLLPLDASDSTRVDVLIEQYSGYLPGHDLKAVQELLLARLLAVSPERYKKLKLNIKIIAKDQHPYNGYVDTVANCWGSPDQQRKTLLKRAKLPGHCLIRPTDEAAYERLLLALQGGSELRASDWYNLLQAAGDNASASTSLVFHCLQQMGEKVHSKPVIWKSYLDEVQQRLRAKDFHLSGLSRALDWLQQYQPEGEKLPGSLRLQQLSARLALQNHQGHSDNDALLELFQLANGLRDEMAQQACEALLRVVVAASNAMDFRSCEPLLEEWLALPVATVGLLNHGKLLSSRGQLLAFRRRYAEADESFADAIGVFDRLSDRAVAQKELQQTRTYKLFNRLRLDVVDDESLRVELNDYFMTVASGGENKSVFARLACGGQNLRFAQQLAWRATFERPDVFATEQQKMLAAQSHWQTGEDHPWPLIQFWRGMALWQAGRTDDALEHWQGAVDLCEESGGITLEWMAAVLQAVAAALHSDISAPSCSQLDGLQERLPLANHQVLQSLCDHPQTDISWLLAQMESCLPFNFH